MSSLMDILYIPMGYLMRFACYITQNNYLLAILLFTLIMEIILSPIQIKQQRTQIKQAKLQPMINVITRKYEGRNDNVSRQKKQQEIMEVYQREGFNPAGGCLPLLIQLPIIWALYRVIITPLRYICGLTADSVNSVISRFEELSIELPTGQQTQPFIINHFREHGIAGFEDIPGVSDTMTLPNYELFGKDLSLQPSFKEPGWLWLIPVLVFLATLASSMIMRKFMYQSPESQDAQNATSMKIMNVTMPMLSAFIAFQVPVAIAMYWIFRNILSTVERFIISKAIPIPRLTPEEMKAAEREYLGKKPKKERDPNKPPVKSLHRIDFDDEPLPPPSPDRFDRAEEEEAKGKASDNDADNGSVSDEAPETSSDAEGEVRPEGRIDKAPLKNDDRKKDRK